MTVVKVTYLRAPDAPVHRDIPCTHTIPIEDGWTVQFGWSTIHESDNVLLIGAYRERELDATEGEKVPPSAEGAALHQMIGLVVNGRENIETKGLFVVPIRLLVTVAVEEEVDEKGTDEVAAGHTLVDAIHFDTPISTHKQQVHAERAAARLRNTPVTPGQDQIAANMYAAGWSKAQVEAAMKAAAEGYSPELGQ